MDPLSFILTPEPVFRGFAVSGILYVKKRMLPFTGPSPESEVHDHGDETRQQGEN